jgi:hypothetical protein
MLSPLPRNKRAKNPRQAERDAELAAERAEAERAEKNAGASEKSKQPKKEKISTNAAAEPSSFGNAAFAQLDEKLDQK